MNRIKYLTAVIVAVLVLVIAPINVWVHFGTMETVSGVQIVGKERINDESGSKYLVFGKDETFENIDSWLSLKFNSSDVYGTINAGQTCKLLVTGVRMPFFSLYRNILSAECRA